MVSFRAAGYIPSKDFQVSPGVNSDLIRNSISILEFTPEVENCFKFNFVFFSVMEFDLN